MPWWLAYGDMSISWPTIPPAVLSEVLAAFLTMAALVCFAISLGRGANESDSSSMIAPWRLTPRSAGILGAFLTGLATLVRPEMPLLLVAAGIVYFLRWRKPLGLRKVLLTGGAMGCAFLLPLARPGRYANWITLHEAQILAPRYVTLTGEVAPVGYYAWTGTWLERYRETYT